MELQEGYLVLGLDGVEAGLTIDFFEFNGNLAVEGERHAFLKILPVVGGGRKGHRLAELVGSEALAAVEVIGCTDGGVFG